MSRDDRGNLAGVLSGNVGDSANVQQRQLMTFMNDMGGSISEQWLDRAVDLIFPETCPGHSQQRANFKQSLDQRPDLFCLVGEKGRDGFRVEIIGYLQTRDRPESLWNVMHDAGMYEDLPERRDSQGRRGRASIPNGVSDGVDVRDSSHC